MTEHKRDTLKALIKLKTLAALAGISQNFLSSIINNKKKCSYPLAVLLADSANTLISSDGFLTPQDFLQ